MLYKGGPHFIPYVQYHKVYYSLPALEISELIFLSLYINILLSRILFRINIKKEKKKKTGKKWRKWKYHFISHVNNAGRNGTNETDWFFKKIMEHWTNLTLHVSLKKKIILKFILSFWLMTEMLKKKGSGFRGCALKKKDLSLRFFDLKCWHVRIQKCQDTTNREYGA